jgi:protein O-GlcNAc transferase
METAESADYFWRRGVDLQKQGDVHEAVQSLRRAVVLDPALPEAWRDLAAGLHALEDNAVAIDSLRQAIALRPNEAEWVCDLAVLLQICGRSEEAAQQYALATERDPTLRRGWYNLGCLFGAQDRDAEAVGCFQRALELDPTHAASHHNLGQSLFNLGDTDAAIEHYRQALALGAGAPAETMLAMTIAVSPTADAQTVLDVRRIWARRHLPQPMFSVQPRAAVSGDRPLRIGYVSAYFDYPNWMKPVWALVNRHDRGRFELFLYSDGQPAQVPSGYRADRYDHFHWTARLSNVELAQLIAGHELDLLVDLNGFSRIQRLPVFALRPAPLNVGWFNTFATTGADCFDYLLGDETVIAPGEESDYCERVVRLAGCYLTFEVAYPVPDVSPLPCLGEGPFTFGSLASLYKITPQVVALWGRILRQAPQSRLLLRNKHFQSSANRAWFCDLFARHNVSPDRLLLEGPADHFSFLRTYDRIDLALDTFPYNGGTTTSEALWQGVPVVTIHGDRWTSRVSSSLLACAGLEEFVVGDTDAYVELAAALAGDAESRSRLAKLRLSLRERLLKSSVCDAETFTRRMERAYVDMVAGRAAKSM